MTMVPFPSRTKTRDYETDRERFDKLFGVVKGLCDEIAYDAAVLFERHAEVMVTAGLPLPDFDDGDEPAMPPNGDENTRSIMRQYKLLEAQLAFLEGIEKQVVEFRASLDK